LGGFGEAGIGVRTRKEIDREKYALKALRGDFKGVSTDDEDDEGSYAEKALRAVRRA
jgi:hypothetical protein